MKEASIRELKIAYTSLKLAYDIEVDGDYIAKRIPYVLSIDNMQQLILKILKVESGDIL